MTRGTGAARLRRLQGALRRESDVLRRHELRLLIADVVRRLARLERESREVVTARPAPYGAAIMDSRWD